jgi:hypothetical protein
MDAFGGANGDIPGAIGGGWWWRMQAGRGAQREGDEAFGHCVFP